MSYLGSQMPTRTSLLDLTSPSRCPRGTSLSAAWRPAVELWELLGRKPLT
jgi:hypothetical protein